MRTLMGALLLAVAACGSRAESPPSDGADTSATALKPDSVRQDSNQVIGHDSAFGPMFAVDSTGKLVELPRRKP